LNSTASCEALSNRALQNLKITSLAETELEFVVCLDLRELLNDRSIVNINATETCEGLCSGLVLVLLDKEARGLR
jgi:hypothetical protein